MAGRVGARKSCADGCADESWTLFGAAWRRLAPVRHAFDMRSDAEFDPEFTRVLFVFKGLDLRFAKKAREPQIRPAGRAGGPPTSGEGNEEDGNAHRMTMARILFIENNLLREKCFRKRRGGSYGVACW